MTIKNEEITSKSFNALNRNEYQGHIAWCFNKTENGNCYGVNFLTLKSLDIKWVSRILNAPTFNYSCRWCGSTKRFDSIISGPILIVSVPKYPRAYLGVKINSV